MTVDDDDDWCPTPIISHESWGGGDIRWVPCGDCFYCRRAEARETNNAVADR